MNSFTMMVLLNNFNGRFYRSYYEKNASVDDLLKSNPPVVFLGKGVLNICSNFTGEHTCRSLIL